MDSELTEKQMYLASVSTTLDTASPALCALSVPAAAPLMLHVCVHASSWACDWLAGRDGVQMSPANDRLSPSGHVLRGEMLMDARHGLLS